MKINQIYSLLNDINAQMFGKDAVQVKDMSGIISMGQTIIGNTDNTDKFLGILVDRIGKTVVRTLDLELDFPTLYMESFEFGAILQKITVNPFSAIQANEWNAGANDFQPSLLDIHKPEVVVKYFTGTDVWSFQVTIPDDLFNSAFTSEQMLGQFVDAIISAMTDSMTLSLNNMSRTAVNNLIAEKILAGHNVVNLLTMYNTATSSSLTADAAMHTKEFYRFSANVIRKYIKYLREPSYLYNEGNVLRATARDNMHVLMLTDFVAGFESYLSADTFHNDLLGMPLYNEVAYWQGNKGAAGENVFSVNSTINIVPSSEESIETASDRYAINQSGIVCVLADRQAVAVGLNNRRSGSFYNSIDFYSNIKSSAKMQYINDLSENVVVFVVASSTASPALSLDKTTLTFANSSAADQTVTATTVPADATVTWKSSKTAVATVAAGVVSAAGAGECTITASITVGGVTITKEVAVTVGSTNTRSK